MSSTNHTTNYELSQYVGADKPTYLGDYNSDMLKIDTQMKTNADNISANTSAIATASANATQALSDASTAQTAANNAQSAANTADTTANSALSKANANESAIGIINAKSIATFKPSADKTYTSTSAYWSSDITNLAIENSKGSHITIDNNGFFNFDSSVSNIKISANFDFNSTSTGLTYTIVVRKEDSLGVRTTLKQIPQVLTNGYFQNIVLSPLLIPINEGDKIFIRLQIETANKSTTIKADDTYVTVEEI